jgi:transcriptional regulator with XRE-family HTH domain
MSIADWDPSASNGLNSPVGESQAGPLNPAASFSQSPGCQSPKPLHRLASVRRQQGVSLRNMARRLKVDVSAVCQQEQETSDLPLSILYEWQKVLDVPVAELLVDSDGPLSAPVMERARLVKLMKTAAAIMEKAHTPSMRRMVTMLVEQLVEIMPELRDVAPWHTVGQRRTLDDYGRAVERQLPDDVLRRLSR